MKIRDEKLREILDWANGNEDIRAVILTSSLVNPLAPVDDFSDLDVELIFEDNQAYIADRKWLNLFGKPISMIEEDESCFNGIHAMKMVLYEDTVKVDFKLYRKSSFLQEIQYEELPEDWDIGYKILLDKDGITQNMKPPTHRISIIKKPDEKDFTKLFKDFWWDCTYVAKCLARGDIFYAKFVSENILRTEYLVPLLEWHIANQHNWDITTNKHGRLFKKYLSQDLWSKTEQTFSGSNIEENWKALFSMTDIMGELGKNLAEALNYSYPSEMENNIRTYLETVYKSCN
ncbi:AadS family aminoglycoside 6-adenylyltransferase [Elizabethkingia miricola]|uniref:AadS family aminoglycoside 6-adenylyltransferase n=1 Tax=Elizabethkingia miricola TaxID=172045 RepID=UPI000B35B14B|nr:AadS family aminoglycoside 6-adenylyltransferase [Elizabethkingia miricola]NHQ65659.1 AadS family aminoglycoside 6-adenylyltransferase [Elizabethkingia miricola]NHQ69089.1 AadS family aminoglycoside 6-adenylyltransferase [Elizabethkingia miricola]NHQ76461.1 AadS family aminoglycoside 6-adenylyltransferase [Elizabethkingia miricola]PSL90308.1 AadS family aminoglycoside 6-adenylyltransferase [Elizabethkingia miricola]QHQ86900.1 AadS family aminoglycoside 6-adenylyltransferase [Elizabethkingia